jgi:PST family polysaccharide transporter
MPFGLALTLFAPDLVRFALGHKWDPAVRLIQIFGLIGASHHVGFNWSAFYRARGDTRPIAIVNAFVVVLFMASVVPLTIADGLDGFGIAMAISAIGALLARSYFLTRLFPGFAMATHFVRAIAPSVPAAAAVLGLRAIESGSRTLAIALTELAVYVAVTVLATIALERPLLQEVLGYVRPRTT